MIVQCGACEQRMTIGLELMGQQVQCPGCGTAVLLPGATAPVAAPPVMPAVIMPAAGMQPRVAVPPSRGGPLVHRCPACRSDVEHGNTLCPRCGVNIKRARKKARRY